MDAFANIAFRRVRVIGDKGVTGVSSLDCFWIESKICKCTIQYQGLIGSYKEINENDTNGSGSSSVSQPATL